MLTSLLILELRLASGTKTHKLLSIFLLALLSDSDTTEANLNTNGIEPAKIFFLKAFDCQRNDIVISRLDLTKEGDYNATATKATKRRTPDTITQ